MVRGKAVGMGTCTAVGTVQGMMPVKRAACRRLPECSENRQGRHGAGMEPAWYTFSILGHGNGMVPAWSRHGAGMVQRSGAWE